VPPYVRCVSLRGVSASLGVILGLAGVAFAAGFIDAIAGGGGLLTVPALLAAGVPPHAALATNKGQSVFGAIAATVAYARTGALDVRLGRLTFPLGFAGSLVGARLVLWMSPAALKPLVLVLLPLAAAVMLVRRPGPGGEAVSGRRRVLIAGALALGIGCYDGFFGPGTGTFLVIGFATLLHATPLSATADAKVVNLASNLAAVLMFASQGQIRFELALPMAAAQLTGAWVGAHTAMRGGDRIVRLGVLLVVAALVVKLGVDLVRG
jgi:uncharacterized membrane protein YfcA